MADARFINMAKEANADSFWYKEISEYELLDIMDRTMNGENIYPDKTPDVQIGTAKSSNFTKGELRVLRLLVQGLSDAEIAESLGISITTVRWYVRVLFEKTGYKNRVSLACDVINKELIVPGF
jgi:two-component system vancomycin resistance associated response regulator VraR